MENIRLMKSNISCVTVISLFASACSNQNDSELIECPRQIACTEEFVSIPITIIADVGNLSSKTIMKRTNEVIHTSSFDGMFEHLILIDDNNIDDITYQEEGVTFELYADDVLLRSVDYTVTHDCCHVLLVEG